MKRLLFIVFLLVGSRAFSQHLKDTLIEGRKFEITQRYKNGKVKMAGEFYKGCADTIVRNGESLKFNTRGKVTKMKFYCNDHRFNRRILGLKHGYWGCSTTTKYFFGINRFTTMSSPCF
jgi:hypothetical protein